LTKKFENLGKALQYSYPEIEWDLDKFSYKGKKSFQRWLKVVIEEILPGIEIVENYKHPDLNWGRFVFLTRLVVLNLRIGAPFGGGSLAPKSANCCGISRFVFTAVLLFEC
jgi:hypothetical protein